MGNGHPRSNSSVTNLLLKFDLQSVIKALFYKNLFIDRGANDFLFEVFATTGNISQLGFYNNGVWSYSPLGAVVWGAWQHVAVTYDGATREIKFYVNGVVVSTQTRTVPLIVNGGDVNIGRQGPNNCQCNPFIGWLDEV